MKNKNIYLVVTALAFGFLVGQRLLARDIWTGFYYSDKENIEDQRTWFVSPPLYSLEECREWVNAVMKEGDDYDYTCGQGCRFTTEVVGETTICRTDAR